MSFYRLRLEYSLEGSSNYITWKDMMEAVLEDNVLKEFKEKDIPKPTGAQDLAESRKCVEKERRIILEGVRDHIVSNLHYKETPFAMWKALTYLFQNNRDDMKLALKDKLRKIKMDKGDLISKYLIKFTQCRDELGSVSVIVAEEDLVSLTLLGLPKSWHKYRDSVNGREKIPEWERLWPDLVQKEIQRNTKDGSSSKKDNEENRALAGKAKKGKGKSSHSKSDCSQGGKKKDMSKIKFFHYHELRHYATKCLHNKVSKNPSRGLVGEALAS